MSEPSLGPYARAAGLYWDAGWHGALPLPAGRKASPPKGYTGSEHNMPSFADITAWCQGSEGGGNIGIRLPRHVLGIDVDQYGSKHGRDEIDRLATQLGTLPPTWITGSRLETGSGISLYTVPEALAWPGEVAPAVEIIQYRHRYAVVWPSVHPEGRTYRWAMPDGSTALDAIPQVDELPALPQAWIEHLTGGAVETDYARNLDIVAWQWFTDHGLGMPCRQMGNAQARYITELADPSVSRHDVTKRATMRICRMITEGHTGGTKALGALYDAFMAATAGEGRDATSEYRRMLDGAVYIAAAAQSTDIDPCEDPFASLTGHRNTGPNVALNIGVPLAADGGIEGHTVAATGLSGTSTDVTTAGADVQPVEHSSWWPVDMTALLSGHNATPEPSFLQRADGASLFYAGKVNGIIGESESGKSFIALLAVAQALAAGLRATYLDFEDTGATVIDRLRGLGVDDKVLREQFHYIGPHEALSALASNDLVSHLTERRPDLIVLDGMNAAMTLLGLDLMSNTDATKFTQILLGPLRTLGTKAAVIYVDHLPKAKDTETKGGIGAQAKRAMTDGCALRAEVVVPFGRGQSGSVKLSVDKDRPGHVRGMLTGAVAGTVVITAASDGTLAMSITAPNATPIEDRPDFRPTILMAKVSTFLSTMPGQALSKNQVRQGVKGNNSAIDSALDQLVLEGFVTRMPGKANAIGHTFHHRFSTFADGILGPTSPTSPNLAQTSPEASAPDPRGEVRPLALSVGGAGELAGRPEIGDEDQDEPTSPKAVSIPVKLPGGDAQAAAIRACIERGGRPVIVAGVLTDASTGEVLL